MRTIELECPSCQEMLELDAGFAGGVCRCSKCGTLMTVPKGKGQAETLSRPSVETKHDDADDLASLSAAASSSKRDRVAPGEYRTASGKVVKLDKSVRVPTASARKKARIATAIVFFSIVFVGVLAGGVAIMLIMNSGPGPGGADDAPQAIQYDAAANPYTLDFLNLAGLPLEGSIAVVVEGSANSEDWSIDFADMVVNGLSQARGSASIGFIAASSESYAPIETTPASGLSASDLADWFTNLPIDGTPDFDTALTAAIDTAPDTLIVVASEINDTDLDDWSEQLASQPTLAVHVILIDNSAIEIAMRDWLSEHDSDSKLITFESGNFQYLKDIAAE